MMSGFIPQQFRNVFPLAAAPKAAIFFPFTRSVNYVTPVKNQNPCGSCWDFASVAALEVVRARDTRGLLQPLSEQYVLDCIPKNQGERLSARQTLGFDEEFQGSHKRKDLVKLLHSHLVQTGEMACLSQISKCYCAASCGAPDTCDGGCPRDAVNFIAASGLPSYPNDK